VYSLSNLLRTRAFFGFNIAGRLTILVFLIASRKWPSIQGAVESADAF